MDRWMERFQLPMLAGEILLTNGAEIFRVEQTIERMAKALGAQRVDVLAVLSGIQASFSMNQQVYTYIRRIKMRRTGLRLIAQVNQISREFCNNDLSYEDALVQLNELLLAPPHSFPLRKALASACGAFAFSLLFQLRLPIPLFYATLNGFFASLMVDLFNKWKIPEYLSTFLTSFVLAMATLLYPLLGQSAVDRVLLAALFLLLPGVPLTTSIRELTNGDLISGTARLSEAMISLITIAAGVYTAFTILHGRL